MENDAYYNTIEKTAVAEYKDRGSKFLAYVYPLKELSDFKEKLAALKKEHPKAVHHCFAYRLGLDSNTFRVSYFGGTLLGVPGLINAYRTAASLALQITPVVQKPVLLPYRLQFDYTQMNDVMKVVKQFDCAVQKQETVLFCVLEMGIPRNRLDEVLFRLKELRGVEVEKF